MLIHEVRRRADETPEHVFAGQKLQFKANAEGHVVCDVPDDIAEELLSVVGGAMVAYGVAVAQAPVAVPAPTPASEADQEATAAFTITSPDGAVFDLGPMSDDEIRAFAAEQGLAKPHHSKKGDKLRQAVIDALKAA